MTQELTLNNATPAAQYVGYMLDTLAKHQDVDPVSAHLALTAVESISDERTIFPLSSVEGHGNVTLCWSSEERVIKLGFGPGDEFTFSVEKDDASITVDGEGDFPLDLVRDEVAAFSEKIYEESLIAKGALQKA